MIRATERGEGGGANCPRALKSRVTHKVMHFMNGINVGKVICKKSTPQNVCLKCKLI